MATATVVREESYDGGARASGYIASLGVTASSSTTDVIPISPYLAASVFVASGAAATSLAIYGAETAAGTMKVLRDKNGTALTVTVAADSWSDLPTEAMTHRFIALVSNSGTFTGKVMLKA